MTNRDEQDIRYWLTDKGWAATASPARPTLLDPPITAEEPA